MKKNKRLIFDDSPKELSEEKKETLDEWIGKIKEERSFKDIVIIQTPFHSNDNFIRNLF